MKIKEFFYVAFVTVMITAVFWSPVADATNGMKVIGVGPIQRSMGGASVGLPLDAACTITNPAGILLLGRRIDFGVTYFTADVNYKANSNFGMITKNGATINSDSDPFVIPAFGMILPINDKFTFGVGAYGVSGMGVDYKKNLYQNVTFTEYTFMKFAPAIAYSVNDKLSIGVAPNIDYSTMDYEAGSIMEVAHHGGTAYGYGFTLGTVFQATDILFLGLAYESQQWFSDYAFNTISGEDKLDFDQPQNVTIGAGIKPNERIRLAFDVVWIDWTQVIGKNKPAYTKNSSGATSWNMNWDDQFVFKLGAEFELNEKIVLRAGYNYGKNPLDKNRSFESIAFPAIAEHHITCGAGINLTEKLALNLGVMYSPEVSFDVANAAGQYINSATTEMSQLVFDVGLSYKF